MTAPIRRVTPPHDGLVVNANPGSPDDGAAARVRVLGPDNVELTVLPCNTCFSSIVTINRMAAGAMAVELLRAWPYNGHSLARLHAAEQAVEQARNSGDGTVPLGLIDELTEAVRQTIPPADLAGGA